VFGWDATQQQQTIEKRNPYGALLWRRVFPNYAASERAMGFTGRDGEIVLTGSSESPLDLGCGVRGAGAFVAQLSTDGGCQWHHGVSGTNITFAAGDVDDWHRVIVTGSFSGTLDFGDTKYSSTQRSSFAAQYDRNGELVWTKVFAGAAEINSMATDGANAIHLAGVHRGTVDFGGGPMTESTAYDTTEGAGFMVTLDSNGAFVRQRQFGIKVSSVEIGAAPDGRVVLGGKFLGSVDFDGNTLTNTSGSRDLFLTVFEPTGKTRWVKKLWGTSTLRFAGVGFDPWGYVSVAGRFNKGSGTSSSLHIGPYDFTTTDSDLFAAHFTPKTGATVWARAISASGTGLVAPVAAAVTPNNGRILVGGFFNGTVDFGDGAMSGTYEGFLVRLHP
jgi:hypothetical protein